jgi:hypothetical protein
MKNKIYENTEVTGLILELISEQLDSIGLRQANFEN